MGDPPRRPSEPPLKVSPSPPSADSPEEVVLRESPLTSTLRPAPSSRDSSRTLSETQSPHRTRQEKDRHRPRCRLRSQETRQNPLRIRRMNNKFFMFYSFCVRWQAAFRENN